MYSYEQGRAQILNILGFSEDGRYVELDVNTPFQVDGVLGLARGAGLRNDEVVRPELVQFLFRDRRTQYLHVDALHTTDRFFFRTDAINKMREFYQIKNSCQNGN